MPHHKILITDDIHPLLIEGLVTLGFETDYFPNISNNETNSIIKDYFGLVLSTKTIVDKSMIDNATQLKFVGRAGSGMENIDVAYAKQNNIYCFNSPEGNCQAVAEHVLGLILNMLNNINLACQQVKQGIWLREENRGEELKHKTCAIIGFGHTGQRLASLLKAFDVKLLVHDPYVDFTTFPQFTFSSISEIQKEADVVSIHVPLTNETKFCINTSFFDGFAKPIYFVNASRGKVVRTDDLIKALQQNKIKAAALDVLETEPIAQMNVYEKTQLETLSSMPQVILTPHIAGWTYESKIGIAQVLLDKIKAWYTA